MGGGVSGVGSTDTNSARDALVRSAVISGVMNCGAATAASPVTAQPVMARQPIGECCGPEFRCAGAHGLPEPGVAWPGAAAAATERAAWEYPSAQSGATPIAAYCTASSKRRAPATLRETMRQHMSGGTRTPVRSA